MIPKDEDLVEAKVAWDLGKFLGLEVSNDEAMIAALSKVKDCQDFVLLKKRGQTKKNKGSM